VQKPLNGLLTNLSREVARTLKRAIEARNPEAERHWSLLFMMLRLAASCYKSVCFLLISARDDPKVFSRRALAIPPIKRQIMDAPFSLVYMTDDFPARSLEYEVSGYRQLGVVTLDPLGSFWVPHPFAILVRGAAVECGFDCRFLSHQSVLTPSTSISF